MSKILALKNIRIDGGTQSRVKMFDEPTVERYLEVLKRGDELPAVKVVFDGKDNWLWDGFNRYETYRRFGRTKIEAEISKGSQRDAILLSFGANDEHGLQRSDDDKRNAVLKALADPEWSQWSNVAIAKACKVSESFVRKLKAENPPPDVSASSHETKIVIRGGKTFEMNTGNIGGKSGHKPERAFNPRKDDRVMTPDGPGTVKRSVRGLITQHGTRETTYDVHLDVGRYQRGYHVADLTPLNGAPAIVGPLKLKDRVMTPDGPGIVKEIINEDLYEVRLPAGRIQRYKRAELVYEPSAPDEPVEQYQRLTINAMMALSDEELADWKATYRALKARYCTLPDNPLLLAEVNGHYLAFGSDADAVIGALDPVALALSRWRLLDDGLVAAFPGDQLRVLVNAGMRPGLIYIYHSLQPDIGAMLDALYAPPSKSQRSTPRADAHEEPVLDPVDDYVPDVDEVDVDERPTIDMSEEVKPGVTRADAMRFTVPIPANGSNGNYKRDKLMRPVSQNEAANYDSCQTPAYALDPLLPYLDKNLTVWEAACGEGLLVDALYDSDFLAVVDTDILTGKNFFEFEPDQWDILITNPPFSAKFKWLERAYLLGKPFALLLPVETLGAVTAQRLMQQYGFEIMFLDSRVNFKMPNAGWDGAGAQFAVFWLCWKLLPEKVMFGEIKAAKQEFTPPQVVADEQLP